MRWRGADLGSFVLAGVLLGAGPALAEDPPALDLGAPEGAVRTAEIVRGEDSYELPTGPVGADARNQLRLAGRVVWSGFRHDGEISPLDVMEGYRARLSELGFEEVFACWNQRCGGFDFRFGVAMLPSPAMRMDVRTFGQLSARRASPEAYASILVSRVQDQVFIQTVAITPNDGEIIIGDAPSDTAPSAFGPPLVPGDTQALADRLRENGHLAIDGLEFATGGAAIVTETLEVLDIIARMLTRDEALEVLIVGHSDNEGALQANIDLSQRRAEAVRDALIDRGVPEAQLEARGVGFLAPLTTNTTEIGRNINRRVELVLR